MPLRKTTHAALGALASLCPLLALGGTNTWTVTGPNAANVRVEVARNPATTAYARGGDKFWKSTDGGATWIEKQSGNTSEFAFTIDPNDSNLVLVQGPNLQLLRSTDGATSFTPVAGSFRALRFGGLNNNTLNGVSYNPPYFRRSTNQGTTWTSGTDTGLPPPPMSGVIPAPFEIEVSQVNSNIIFLGFRHPDYAGVYKSTDGGMSWSACPGLPGVFVNAIAMNPAAPTGLFIATDTGLYQSGDNCGSWAKVPDSTSTGVATVALSTIAFDPFDSMVVYAGGNDHGEIFRSANGGQTWSRRDAIATRINSISPNYAQGGPLLAGTSLTVYRSTDAGLNWAVSASGIRSASISALNNGSKLRAGLFDGGIYESVDGLSWTPTNNVALRNTLENQKFSPVIAIADPGRLFAMFEARGELSGSMGSDPGQIWNRANTFNFLHNGSAGGFITASGGGPVHYASSYSGVEKSLDDGLTWVTMNIGLPNPPLVTKLAKNAGASVLFAGTFNQGLYKSTDGAVSWTPINTGLSGNQLVIRQLKYDEINDVLVVGTNDGLLVSRNAGASYTPLASPIPGNQVSTDSLLVEDFDHGAIYFGTNGRVFRSVDKGASWTELSSGAVTPTSFTSVRDLMGDGPGVIYAGYVYHGLHTFTVAPDLKIAATTTPPAGNRAIGSTVSWGFRVTNDGPHASTFSTFDMPLPSTVIASLLVTSRGTCSTSAASLHCDLGIMQPGQTADISFTLTGRSGGTVNINASAGAAEIDPQPVNNTFTNSGVRFIEQVDLATTLTVSNATIDSGSTVDYTLTVRNNGPNAVTGASLEYTFDSRDQYALVQGSSNGCLGSAGGARQCALPTLAANASLSWRWTVTAIPGGARTLTASATVDADKSTDNNLANNSAAGALTVVAVNDMSVTLVAAQANVNRGSTAQYTLQVSHSGVIPAPNVEAHMTLPIGLQFANSTGNCTAAGVVVTCVLGTIDVGALALVNVTLNATAAAAVNVTADVVSGNPDRNAANNTDTKSLTIAPVGDLAVTLTSSLVTVQVGTPFTYTLTVSNAVGSDTANGTATVQLSNLLTYTSATGATCVAAGSVVTCSVGSLVAGASATVTLNVNGTTAGTATSSAGVTSSIVDSSSVNNMATAAGVTITNPPPPPSPPSGGGGGGGGGAFDYTTALVLTALLAMTLYTRQRRMRPRA
ncbi:MAG: hypothetical protein ABI769_01605 [Pseudomonadota bacterium]